MGIKILVIDIETTGFLNKGGKIVEIGIVELDLQTGAKDIIYDQIVHEFGTTKEEVKKAWIIENSSLTLKDVVMSPTLESEWGKDTGHYKRLSIRSNSI